MKIHHLSPVEAQKIAAGEVVERPAHTLKELLENSLDAGATRITIRLEEGGKRKIIITDNGCGMSPEDARISFLRHTTSKLTTFNELESLQTFGFRGEALASICSVARVTLTTKESHAPHATRLFIEQSTLVKEEVVSFQNGTCIEIDDLFCTVPARKKFLKTATTELNHCIGLFKALCLNHISVHFTLIHEGSTLYHCPPAATLNDRVIQLFDAYLEKQLHTVSCTKEHLSITGVLTGAHYKRYDRSGIFFFVNKRWVKNFKLTSAFMKGYLNLLPPGRYPLGIIQITLPAHEVDINTHPKKEEVVFLHPRIIEQAITQSVTQSLEKTVTTQLQTNTSSPTIEPSSAQWYAQQSTHTSTWFPKQNATPSLQEIALHTQMKHDKNKQQKYNLQNISSYSGSSAHRHTEKFILKNEYETSQHQEQAHTISYALIGQYKNTYLLLEHPEGLLILDQHAAHERILYEQFAQRFINQETVTLMFPEIITLSAHDYILLEPHLTLFTDQGIIIEPFGNNQYAITATPVYAKNINMHDLVQETISYLKETDATNQEQFFKMVTEKMRAQMACKAAIKAGDTLSNEKMTKLLHDLEKTANRFSCPHGRPTSWLLDILTIEKKFKRKI